VITVFWSPPSWRSWPSAGPGSMPRPRSSQTCKQRPRRSPTPPTTVISTRPSGKGDWDFGQVYRDRDYKVTYPLTNNCRVGQVVTITYPTAFPMTINLTGPTEVAVGPYSTVDVPMLLKTTEPPLPRPPYPIGMKVDCYDIKGDMTLVHPRFESTQLTAKGKETYICHEMERTHTISMHVHQHGPPEPPGGGGGKKKTSPTCDMLWNHNEFYPAPGVLDPSGCRDEIRQLVIDFVEEQVKPLGAADKEKLKWAWVPNREQLAKMPVDDLLEMKKRAEMLAIAPKK